MDNNNKFVERLKWIFKRNEFSKKDLERGTGFSYTAVQNWFKHGTSDKQTIKKIAEFYNCNFEWLYVGLGDPFIKDNSGQPIQAYDIRAWKDKEDLNEKDVMISMYDIELSAGNGSNAPEFVKTKYKLPFSLDWIQKKGFHANDLKLIKVRGDSMSPTVNDGDAVLINIAKKDIVDGKIYAISSGNELKIKRLKRTFNGGLVIMSDNDAPMYENETLSPEDMQYINIIGLGVHRSGDI